MKYPNLFLVGAPKCGTTSLAYYLGQHSQIFDPIIKEPGFFGSDLTRMNRGITAASYLDLYAAWKFEKYAIDATPLYFFSESAAFEIKEKAPKSNILIMVRNPIEAAYSMYFQAVFDGTETLSSFEESLDAEPARAARREPVKYGVSEKLLYSRIFAFTSNIERYEKAFGRDKVFVGLLDDLKADPELMVTKICQFLEISDNLEKFNFEKKNESKRIRRRWINTLANYPPGWLGYVSKSLLSRESRVRLRNFITNKNTVETVNPPMRHETRARLSKHFAPEIEKLSRYLNRDLSYWLENEA